MALPFSLESLSAAGEPFVVASNATKPSVAADGTLVYQIQGVSSDQLVWVDRRGAVVGRIGQPQDDIRFVTLFKDGRRVAVRGSERDADEVWIHDSVTGQKTRLTFDAASEGFPVPSPSGEEIVFTRMSLGQILEKRSDGSGEEKELLKGFRISANDWSPDGRYLLGSVDDKETTFDLWYIPLDGARKPVPFLKTPTAEAAGRFSPDGRFVAYSSDETGQSEVYVKTFPSGDGKWQISSQGGCQPHWSKTSGELFYLEGQEMMVAKVFTTPGFSFQAPRKLFTAFGMRTATTLLWPSMFDVAPDGQRFVMVQTTGKPVNRLVIVQGLFSGPRS